MPRVSVATDNFNRASLGTDWEQLYPFNGEISIDDSTRATGSSAGGISCPAARWVGAGSFTNDQYVKAEIRDLADYASGYITGVIVRASGDTDTARDFYSAFVESVGASPYPTRLYKVVNGTATQLANTTVAWSVGDFIELEVEGASLRVYRNGTQITALNATDSALTTGKPGLILANACFLDNWEGGNVTASGLPRRQSVYHRSLNST